MRDRFWAARVPLGARGRTHLALHLAQVGQELIQLPGGRRGGGRGGQRLWGQRGAAAGSTGGGGLQLLLGLGSTRDYPSTPTELPLSPQAVKDRYADSWDRSQGEVRSTSLTPQDPSSTPSLSQTVFHKDLFAVGTLRPPGDAGKLMLELRKR